MELNRLRRVIRERWWLVVLIAVIGFLAAFGFTTLGNRNLDTIYEAVIPLRFEPQEGETIQDLTKEVTEASAFAILAADSLLRQYPGSSIFPDTSSGRLLFSARGDTQEEALERAQELISAYYAADPVAGGDIEAQLGLLEEQAIAVAEQIEQMQPALSAEEQLTLNEHQILDRSIASIGDQIVALNVADATATDTERQANAAAREGLHETLEALVQRKSALGPPPVAELSTSEQLRLDTLRLRLDLLKTEYQNLSLRSVGISSGEIQETASLSDITPRPSSPVLNGVIGLVIGAGVALFALILTTRLRREVWLAEDVPVTVLGRVPHRKVANTPGPSWYDSVVGGRRKEGIQAIRTALDGLLGHGSTGFAVSGDRVGPEATQALAADIAGSFASAGRSVLLVDADYANPSTSTEFDVGEPSLSTILNKAGDARAADQARTYLEEAIMTRPYLAVIPAGEPPDTPADFLAGAGFRLLIDTAREMFDVVIVVAGDAGGATSQVVTQRVGAALIAIAPGRTTSPHISSVLGDLQAQRVVLPGVVMIHGSEPRTAMARGPRLSQIRKRSNITDRDAVNRLGSYPFPGMKRSLDHAEGSLTSLTSGLETAEATAREVTSEEDQLGVQVLEALRRGDPHESYDRVADYVVARVEDVMTAVPGQENVSEDLIDRIAEFGFLPVSPVRGQSTIGECLVAELKREVGVSTGEALLAEIARILERPSDQPIEDLNRWISSEFFRRHIERTSRSPEIWHLCSRSGTVALLVAARKLNDERLHLISTYVVRRKIDEIERHRRLAIEEGAQELIDSLDEALREVHEFEVALTQLRSGSSQEARLSYPWRSASNQPKGWNPVWAEGMRANIAPLQRLGLLPVPVLDDEDLETLITV
jgi:hypothetical protein